mmetsp:Transcript_2348/g.2840  ORF Transcript_2348/g.2840 Transcript_2348/m.2840 type:complete len:107 (+) Transcript_2348:114-434(+)
MGCCFGKTTFQGEGQRLGSVTTGSARNGAPPPTSAQRINDDDRHEDHQPIHDPNIDDAIREQRRAEREAAAKARMEKNQVSSTKKKTKKSSELRGPNSRNTMTWTL